MGKNRIFLLSFLSLFCLLTHPLPLFADKGASVSGGLTLLQDYSARSYALAGTIGSLKDEISSFGYNPAALSSLRSGHASLLYDRGYTDDTYGQIMAGRPFSFGTLGASLGYYDGGYFDWFDGTTHRDVTAQKDLVFAVGYSRMVRSVSLGVTGKYLSSELIEMEKATAFAADIGAAYDVREDIRISGAIHNIGTKLTFIDEGDDLPRMARLGGSALVFKGKYPTTLLVDLPFMLTESRLEAAVGVEVFFGPVAFRAGYKDGIDDGGLTLGTGFAYGPATLDYGFGLMDELDARHRVSLSLRFGQKETADQLARKIAVPEAPKQASKEEPVLTEAGEAPVAAAAAPVPEVQAKPAAAAAPSPAPVQIEGKEVPRELPPVYLVQPGDTWKTIAKKFYESESAWVDILVKNQKVIISGDGLKAGQRIVLP